METAVPGCGSRQLLVNSPLDWTSGSPKNVSPHDELCELQADQGVSENQAGRNSDK